MSDSQITAKDRRRISELKNKDYSETTLKNYRCAWGLFKDFWKDREGWEEGEDPRPADEELVAAYLAARFEERAFETVNSDFASIRWGHVKDGYEPPTDAEVVKDVMKAIREKAGPDDGRGPKKPLLTKHVRAMVKTLPLEKPSEDTGPEKRAAWLRAHRDRAMLLMGFASAMRGAAVVGLTLQQIEPNDNGIEIYAPEAKNGPRTVGVSYAENPEFCPIQTTEEWIKVAKIDSGPLFRPIKQSAEIEEKSADRQTLHKRLEIMAEQIGLDPEEIGTHSLRRGHMTQGGLEDVPVMRLQKQAGHKDPKTTMRYIDAANRMKQETSQELGL